MRSPRRVFAPLLLALAFGLPDARADAVDEVNALRARGCDGQAGIERPLEPARGLAATAREMRDGKSLKEALAASGYRAARTRSIRLRSSTAAGFAQLLASRFCREATDPMLREIGVARRGIDTWIVVAAPFVAPDEKNADAIARRVLELTNATRAKARRCGDRSFSAVGPVKLDEKLTRAALGHAREMAKRSRMTHEGADGSTPAVRASRAGYKWQAIAENVSEGQQTPEDALQSWIESPGHCANLMNGEFTEMGIAFAFDADSEAGVYWAMVLGRPMR